MVHNGGTGPSPVPLCFPTSAGQRVTLNLSKGDPTHAISPLLLTVPVESIRY